MKLAPLLPHSDCAQIPAAIRAGAGRPEAGRLALRFELEGKLSGLELADAGALRRGDRLWQSSCFEAFIQAGGDTGYLELNLSPSLEWAAYRFEGYRRAMAEGQVPRIEAQTRRTPHRLTVTAEIELPELNPAVAWRVGLSAVLEQSRGGGLAYFALRHRPGEPDFHHPDCFALEVPPPDGP